jgi:hypothetical protein
LKNVSYPFTNIIIKYTAKDKNFDEKIQEDEDNDIMSHLNYRKLQKIKADFVQYDNEGIN